MMNRVSSSPILTDVVFRSNSAGNYGGGMFNRTDCSPSLTNVAFWDNEATVQDGGGMRNSNGSSPTLVNVTLSGNSALGRGGGISNYWETSSTLANCILWGNSAFEGDQLFNESSTATITTSLVGGGCPDDSTCYDPLLDEDPLFVDPAGGDLRLRRGSPAIDAGDNAAVPAGVTTDLAGRPRFVDVPSVVDTGSGTPPIIDMGAYEKQLTFFLPLVLRAAP